MPDTIDIMEKRETEIGRAVGYLSSKTRGFENPIFLMITLGLSPLSASLLL